MPHHYTRSWVMLEIVRMLPSASAKPHVSGHTETWQAPRGDSVHLELLDKAMTGPAYSIWWQLSDRNHSMIKRCEVMIKIFCKATLLRDDDCRLRGKPIGTRMCTRCELGAVENAIHIIMQCPANEYNRHIMHDEIHDICPLIEPQDFFGVILGKSINGWNFEQMSPIWETSATYVSRIYFDILGARQGVG